LCTKAGELVARKLESGHELQIFVKLNHSTSVSLQKEKSSTKSFACTYGWLVGEAQLIHSFKQKSNLSNLLLFGDKEQEISLKFLHMNSYAPAMLLLVVKLIDFSTRAVQEKI
jgi:hypothetical protein